MDKEEECEHEWKPIEEDKHSSYIIIEMHKMWKDEGNLPLSMKLIKFPAVKSKDLQKEIS